MKAETESNVCFPMQTIERLVISNALDLNAAC